MCLRLYPMSHPYNNSLFISVTFYVKSLTSSSSHISFAVNLLNLSLSSFIFSINLYELIKKNNYQGFSLSLIRRFANSIVKCLRLLFQENIIHCDLKPVSGVCCVNHIFHSWIRKLGGCFVLFKFMNERVTELVCT